MALAAAALARALVVPVLLVAGWQLAVAGTGTKMVPPPLEVGRTLWDLCFGGIHDDPFSHSILGHLLASAQRVYGGFFLAVALALPLGLLIGRVPLIRELLDPTLQALRPIPVTAWLPLSMIFFGLGPKAAIFLVFLGAFYPILLNTTFGVRAVEARLFEAAVMLGCSGSAMFRKVVLPAAMPSIFTGLRLGHGFAWILIVVGEMTGVPQGLGAMIMDGRSLARTDLVIAGMLVIGAAGYMSDRVLVALNNRVLRWNPQHRV